MECTYETTINGKKIKFSSEMELDNFLSSKLADYQINESDLTFQINPIDSTIEKVNVITSKVKNASIESVIINDDGDSETILKIPDSIGTTRFITSNGDPSNMQKELVPPFNLNDFLKKERERLSAEGMTKPQIDSYLEKLQKSWAQLTDYGTEIHSLFESIINNTTFKPTNLSEEQVLRLTEEFKSFIEDIKSKYGKNAKILTEVPIISDKIHEAYQSEGIKSINGRIDMLVIDQRGFAHIYDFKVSRKEVGVWEDTRNIQGSTTWHSTKKRSAGYQLGIYKNILAQYGITVGETNIIPIKIDPEYNEDGTINKLNDAYIDFTKIKVNPNALYTETINTILPVKTLLDDIDLINSIQEPMTKFVPNYAVETQVQRNTVTVDKYINNPRIVHYIDDTDPERKFGKYWIWNKYKKNRKVYAKTEEELREKVQELVNEENKHIHSEMSTLADTIQQIIEGYGSIDDLAADNQFKSDYCKKIFRKYLVKKSETDYGWTFQNNPKFVAAGIFVFTKDGKMEIISVTHNDIHSVVNLGLGKSIQGATKKDSDIDSHVVMQASNGNIDLIKVMCLLNNMPEVLKGYKVNKIESHNIWMQKGTETYSETLLDNFSELCRIHGITNNLTSQNFATTLEAAVNIIRDTAGEELLSHMGNWEFNFSPDDIVNGAPFILQKMEQLRKLKSADGLRTALREGKWNFDDPIQLAYMLLGRALNKLNGYSIYIEQDPKLWVNFSREGWYTGSYVNSAGNSSSKNIQTLSKIFSVAEAHVRRKELSYKPRISKVVKAFYEYNHRNRLIGGEVKFFDNLFVKDANGNIDKSFRLKNPSDSSLAKEESDFIKMFLEIVNDFRFDGNQSKIAKAIEDGSYYEVPVSMGSTSTQIHNKGYKQAFTSKYNEALNFLKLLPEQEQQFRESKGEPKVYNKYRLNGLSRSDLIENYGIDGLETQLEDLLLNVIHTYTMEEVMNEYLPRLQGIKIALQYQTGMFGVVTDHVLEYIDKFIDANVYSKPIMAKELQGAYKMLSVVKSITTATALGLNLRSGIREMMQGMWIHLSRTMAEAYGKDQFTKKDVAKAWAIIFKQSVKDVNTLTLIDALNVDYGMANADPHQVQERLSSSKTGVKNLDSDALYFFNRVPDSYHRMGLLIAKMLHDGCYEAHSIVNDQLVYDFKKDKRFNLLSDSKADKNSLEYKKQHALYTAMREQFNREGWNIQDGDDLPRAYTIQEGTSIKSFAELCFGHYDKSTQMLMKQMFLGAMILQFRTFLSAKFEQWILKPDTYNQGQYTEKFDENGVRYVRIFTFDEKGIPSVRIGLETELKPDDVWEPYIEWQGRFMEGIAYSIISFGKTLYKLDFNGFKELWKNPTKRANFYLFLHDMIWMSILMWIVKALFLSGEEDLGPVGHLVGTSLYTSFSDGPITSIMSSMFGDLNPPMHSIVVNLYKQTSGIITGDVNLFDAGVNSFGALNSLKYIGDQLE